MDSITNPIDFVSLAGAGKEVKVQIKTSLGGEIDKGFYSITTAFTMSFIKTFTVTATDLTAGKYPVTYNFAVTPKSKVVKDAYLVV